MRLSQGGIMLQESKKRNKKKAKGSGRKSIESPSELSLGSNPEGWFLRVDLKRRD